MAETGAMPDNTPDAELVRILKSTRTIAAIGVSPNPIRPSYYVARYLSLRGFQVYPINPAAAGQSVFGRQILADLSDIPEDVTIDMVDIFRRPEFVPDIVQAALDHLTPGLKTIWMQYGIRHEGAAETARAAGLQVVQDRCPKIEYQRLFGELRQAGFNTGIISSKLPR